VVVRVRTALLERDDALRRAREDLEGALPRVDMGGGGRRLLCSAPTEPRGA
jgi:hypothetical protein